MNYKNPKEALDDIKNTHRGLRCALCKVCNKDCYMCPYKSSYFNGRNIDISKLLNSCSDLIGYLISIVQPIAERENENKKRK